MTRTEQLQFITDLVAAVYMDIKTKVADGRIPENWDGRELRQLLADKFQESAYIHMDVKRRKEYENTVIINNL